MRIPLNSAHFHVADDVSIAGIPAGSWGLGNRENRPNKARCIVEDDESRPEKSEEHSNLFQITIKHVLREYV